MLRCALFFFLSVCLVLGIEWRGFYRVWRVRELKLEETHYCSLVDGCSSGMIILERMMFFFSWAVQKETAFLVELAGRDLDYGIASRWNLDHA